MQVELYNGHKTAVVGWFCVVFCMTTEHNDVHMHKHVGIFAVDLIYIYALLTGCGQIATICRAMSASLRLLAGVNRTAYQYSLVRSAFTLLVGHQEEHPACKN